MNLPVIIATDRISFEIPRNVWTEWEDRFITIVIGHGYYVKTGKRTIKVVVPEFSNIFMHTSGVYLIIRMVSHNTTELKPLIPNDIDWKTFWHDHYDAIADIFERLKNSERTKPVYTERALAALDQARQDRLEVRRSVMSTIEMQLDNDLSLPVEFYENKDNEFTLLYTVGGKLFQLRDVQPGNGHDDSHQIGTLINS